MNEENSRSLPDPDKTHEKIRTGSPEKSREELENLLKHRKREDDYKRSAKLWDFFYGSVKLILGFAVLVGGAMVVVHLLHIAGPEEWRWIREKDDLVKIENLFASSISFLTGAGLTFVARFLKSSK